MADDKIALLRAQKSLRDEVEGRQHRGSHVATRKVPITIGERSKHGTKAGKVRRKQQR
jgi:hypothetical protein